MQLSMSPRMDCKTPIIALPVARVEGLPLPRPFVIQIPQNSTIEFALSHITSCVESPKARESLCRSLRVSTTDGKSLPWNCQDSISTLLSSPSDRIVPLRLSAPMLGGKGGFGSQLRAAGGRMSSRKKKQQGQQNGSSRNLDGRRLRTITEAKALAEYLVVKPEMDKREKEERKKRWEQVVEMAEQKQEEIKNGGKTRLDGRWMEAKEDATEKTREAILAAIQAGEIDDILEDEESESEISEDDSEVSGASNADDQVILSPKNEKLKESKPAPRTFHGWEEEEELSDEQEEEEIKVGKD